MVEDIYINVKKLIDAKLKHTIGIITNVHSLEVRKDGLISFLSIQSEEFHRNVQVGCIIHDTWIRRVRRHMTIMTSSPELLKSGDPSIWNSYASYEPLSAREFWPLKAGTA